MGVSLLRRAQWAGLLCSTAISLLGDGLPACCSPAQTTPYQWPKPGPPAPAPTHPPHLKPRKLQPQLHVVCPLPRGHVELARAPQQQLLVGLALAPRRRRRVGGQLLRGGQVLRGGGALPRPRLLPPGPTLLPLLHLQWEEAGAGEAQPAGRRGRSARCAPCRPAPAQQPHCGRGGSRGLGPASLLHRAAPALEPRAALRSGAAGAKVAAAAVALRVAVGLGWHVAAGRYSAAGRRRGRAPTEPRDAVPHTASATHKAGTRTSLFLEAHLRP
jgi:hypothetical protein